MSQLSGYNANEQLIIKVREYGKDTAKLRIGEINGWYESPVKAPIPYYYGLANGKGGGGGGDGGVLPQTPSGTKEIIIGMSIIYSLK